MYQVTIEYDGGMDVRVAEQLNYAVIDCINATPCSRKVLLAANIADNLWDEQSHLPAPSSAIAEAERAFYESAQRVIDAYEAFDEEHNPPEKDE